jgi:hypothetical protein
MVLPVSRGADKSHSLSLSEGKDGKLLVNCHKGCTFADVMAAFRSRGLIPDKSPHVRSTAAIIANMAARTARPAPRTYSIEETFDIAEAQVEPLTRGRAWNPHEYERSHIYCDATGNPCRLVAVKRKPDGDKAVTQFGRLADGSWDSEAPKGAAVPYHLPELLAAQGTSPVFIAEGEKDVETLEALGHLATTNAGGALSWHKDLNTFFAGLDVLIVPDADKAGEKRIGMLCDQLAGVAASIKIVRLPGLEIKEKHGEDITDWIKKHGHTKEEFIALAKAAPAYEPAQVKDLLVSSADFAAGFVPPDYAIDGLVQRRYLYSLTANTGGGKTAVALLLAAMKALGRRLGERDVDQGHVLYFAGENPADICARWIALCEQLGVDPAAMKVHFLPGTGKLSDIAPRIKEEVERIGCKVSLIIIDTSIAYFDGDDENNNIQAVLHAHRMRTLINLPGGPCVIVLCHPTKRASREDLLPRGGGAFLNEVDGNLTCWNDDGVVTMHWLGKIRGPDFEPITFQLKTVVSEKIKDSKGRKMPTVLASVLSKEEERVAERNSSDDEDALLLAIADNRRASFAGLAVALGWITPKGENKAKVRRCADRLKKDKLVKPDRRGTLILTPSGEAEVKRLRDVKKAQKS